MIEEQGWTSIAKVPSVSAIKRLEWSEKLDVELNRHDADCASFAFAIAN
jgi:hypothetical protein